MAVRSLLKFWFQTRKKPTQDQYATLIDSYFNLEEDTLQQAQVQNLVQTLNAIFLALTKKADLDTTGKVPLSQLPDLGDTSGGITNEQLTQALAPDNVDGTTTTVTYNLLTGKLLVAIVVKTPADCKIKIGLSDGAEDVMPGVDVQANKRSPLQVGFYAESTTILYISGVPAGTNVKFFKM